MNHGHEMIEIKEYKHHK